MSKSNGNGTARTRNPLPKSLVAGLLGAGLLRATPAWAESTRVERPFTLSAMANAFMPSVGAEVAQQVSDRVAFGAQLTQLLTAHVDASVGMRAFVVANEVRGFYVGPKVHVWYSPLILKGVNPAGTFEAGYEYRAREGFTLAVGVGGGVIWNLHRDSKQREWEPVPVLNLRLGKSW